MKIYIRVYWGTNLNLKCAEITSTTLCFSLIGGNRAPLAYGWWIAHFCDSNSADYKYTTLRAEVSFRYGFQHACTEPFASLWGHSRSWLVCIKYRSSYLNDSDASDYAHAVIKARTLLAGWRLLWRFDKNYVKSGFIRNIKRPSPPLQKKKKWIFKQNLRINKGAHWIGNMDDKNSWQVSVVIFQALYFHGNNGRIVLQ